MKLKPLYDNYVQQGLEFNPRSRPFQLGSPGHALLFDTQLSPITLRWLYL